VMLEGDYLAGTGGAAFKDERMRKLNDYSTQLIKELIIPALNKEINSSPRYAALRQVYYSLILSQWFKARFNGPVGQYASLVDKKDLQGLTSAQPWGKMAYFKEYQKSFNEREYNLKDDSGSSNGRGVKSYYSGGVVVNLSDMFAPTTPVGYPREPAPRQPVMPVRPLPPGTRMPATQPPINPPSAPRPPLTTPPVMPGGQGVQTMPNAPAATASALGTGARLVIQSPPVVLQQNGGPGGFYGRTIPAGRQAGFQVNGLPGRLIVSPQNAPAQTPDKVARIQMGNNLIQSTIIDQNLPPALAVQPPQQAAATGAPDRGAQLQQALASRSPDVYERSGVTFVKIPGLQDRSTNVGLPEVVHIDLTTYGVPVAYIDANHADNRTVEGYAIDRINQLRTEATRIPGVKSLADFGRLMKDRPQEALPVLARINRQQSSARDNLTQTLSVPAQFGYGFTELTNQGVGLPQNNIPLAAALQNPFSPANLEVINNENGRATVRLQENPSGSARVVPLSLVTSPFGQQILALGTMNAVRQSPLGRTGGEAVVRFAELVFQARDTLAGMGQALPQAEREALTPSPVLPRTGLAPRQSSSIPGRVWNAPANGQVNLAVTTPAGVGRISVQVNAPAQGRVEAVVVDNEGNRVPLEAGKPVTIGVLPQAGANALRLVPQLTEATGPMGNYGAQRRGAPTTVTAPSVSTVRLTLTAEGALSVTNVATEPSTSVEVGALRAPNIATGFQQLGPAPASLMPGGIDLRIMPMVTQPIANFSANLNKSTLRTLRNMDLEKEWTAIEKMIHAGFIPSAERIKEDIQAACLQGEIELDMDRIVSNISDILQAQEVRCQNTEPGLKDILIVLGAAASPLEINQVFLGKT